MSVGMTTKSGTASLDLTSANPRYLYLGSITLTAGADAAVVNVRAASASGTIMHQIKAALGTSTEHLFEDPKYIGNGVYVELVSGTTPQISVQVG